MNIDNQHANIIAEHPPLNPRLYMVERWLVRAGVTLGWVALAGQGLLLILGLPGGFSVLPLLMVFTLILLLTLLIAAGLRPPVTAFEDGLLIMPPVGRTQFVAWAAIVEVRDHFLAPSDQTLAYPLQGRKNSPDREGVWLLSRDALPVRYRLVGWLTGLGNVAVFGIAESTHQNYPALRALIKARTGL